MILEFKDWTDPSRELNMFLHFYISACWLYGKMDTLRSFFSQSGAVIPVSLVSKYTVAFDCTDALVEHIYGEIIWFCSPFT